MNTYLLKVLIGVIYSPIKKQTKKNIFSAVLVSMLDNFISTLKLTFRTANLAIYYSNLPTI